MKPKEYDLLVIGAGPAGNTAVDTAIKAGKRVALVEQHKLGGSCLNYGCDPTKTLLYVANLWQLTKKLDRYGLKGASPMLDWPGVQARVQEVITDMRGGDLQEAQASLEKQGVVVLNGQASFVSDHEVAVGDQVVRAAQIVIASGTSPTVPPVEGLKEAGFITNVEAVSLPRLPERLAIMGGGPIGIEFAQMFNRFGVAVTVIERSAVMLETEEGELADQLCRLLEAEGVRLLTGTEPQKVTREGATKRLTLKMADGKSKDLVVDEILVAVGRSPQLEGLNLAKAGVATTKKGIKVDPTLRTNVPHIWAAGDITGGYQFTHMAEEQGRLVAQNAFAASPRPFNDRATPWVTYTQPELAHVGATSQELDEAKTAYRAIRVPFSDIARAKTDGRCEGMVKLLVDPEGFLLGGHILGHQAGELLAPLIMTVRHHLPLSQLADTILPYPTLSQALGEAAKKAIE